jgi:steroid 5-alpha reductase family enzyme
MFDTHHLLLTLGVSLLVQAVFFVFAATLRTDKVTDLSYGLTFILLALVLLLGSRTPSAAEVVLALMVVTWGVRLAGYLLYRIVQMGRDRRFDGIRERFGSFAKFWIFQGIAVWVIMLPVTLWFGRPGPWSGLMFFGACAWLAGLVIETVADVQKFRRKSDAAGRARWVDTGLWRVSRHPNYFGELLCWWSVFLFVAGDLGWWVWLGAAGPVAITVIILFATGLPPLERSADIKWGGDPDYQDYRRSTSVLIPWPRRR